MESYERDLSYDGFVEDPRPKLVSIPIRDIAVIPGWNPRSNPAPSRDLVESVATMGVSIPIKVRWRPDGDRGKEYIVDGERRYWAAKKAGLEEIPAMHYGEMDDKTALLIAAASNENRKNMSTADRVHCSYRLKREGADTKQIAAAMGTSLRLAQMYVKLNGLEDEIRRLVIDGKIAAHVAASLDHPLITDRKRAELVAILPGMPSREAIKCINQAKKNKAKSDRVTAARTKLVNHPTVRALELRLAEAEEKHGASCCTTMVRRTLDCLAGLAQVDDVFAEWQD